MQGENSRSQAGLKSSKNAPVDSGALPPWRRASLPAPPPFNLRNAFTLIGPGAILLAAGLGGGEWLVAPAAAARFGSHVMWIVTVSIVLQAVFNLEAIRYTLYTGEPIYGGFLRLNPGSRFWAFFYCGLCFLSLGWPATAGAAGAVLFSSASGRLPETTDTAILYWITVGVVLIVVLILSIGGTIERTLEIFSWIMIFFTFSFLITVNVLYVPFDVWARTLAGFFSFSYVYVDTEIDWSLMGTLAATAGIGGIGNLTVTNWMRDKGFGMGQLSGAIPSAFSTVEIRLSHVGTIFPINKENLVRWKHWWHYVHLDQIWIWALFSFVGMFLNVNLAEGIIPEGSDLSGLAAGAYQASYLAEHVWQGFWLVALLNGFWILFSTQLGDTDGFVRTITDIIWMSSKKLRLLRQGVRKVYYSLLGLFSVWAFAALSMAPPFILFEIMGNMAGFILMVASLQILRVNRRFLPPELQPSLWRQLVLIIAFLFYGFFFIRWVFEVLS